MTGIAKIRNSIQGYPWGSRTAIASLLGRPSPSPGPEAELWMGAHPKAPSMVLTPRGERSLADLIAEDPQAMLGADVARRFDGRLPFLFKVLAAAEPLSIQAHPSLDQARRGYADENARGVPSRERSYVDENHKPEVLCALTRFHALSGFRDPEEAAALLRAFGMPVEASAAATVAGLYRSLLALAESEKRRAVDRLLTAALARQDGTPEARWIVRALAAHPGDFGAVSILLLNLVELAPGEALYQKAGLLHAYLEGTGIELMANSDNVLRGGLTSKQVDVAELLRVVDLEPAPASTVSAVPGQGAEQVYPTPAAEFRLSRLPLRGRWTPGERSGIELWILTEGTARAAWDDGSIVLAAGESFVVPACAGPYALEGNAVAFRAAVPAQARPR